MTGEPLNDTEVHIEGSAHANAPLEVPATNDNAGNVDSEHNVDAETTDDILDELSDDTRVKGSPVYAPDAADAAPTYT